MKTLLREKYGGRGTITIDISGNNNTVWFKADDIWVEENLIIYMVDSQHKVEIGGKSTFISTTIFLADNGTSAHIGDDCMFSRNITILTSDFHSIVEKESRKRVNNGKDIIIGNHVWVGMGIYILKGAQIGENSVVGAGSIISSSSILSGSVIVGNPGRVINTDITWTRERM